MGVAAMALLMASSCKNGNQEFSYDGETSTYFANAGFVRTLELGEDQEADLTNDNNHIFEIKATYAGGYDNKNNVTINYLIDPSLCEGYTMGGAEIKYMPTEYYTLENSQISIPEGQLTGGIRVHLTDAFFADPKSTESYYVIPVQLTQAFGVDKILADKSTTFCVVKYVNPWHATYLRRGCDVVNGVKTYRHTEYMEKGEVISLTTKALDKVSMIISKKDAEGKAHNVPLLLTFDGDNCTITSGATGVTASGSGKFVRQSENMGGIQRNALYLEYSFETAELGSVQTTDTLVVRNRGVKYETFTPSK